MTIIAAITRDHALGRGGDMIYHISADLKRFKELTTGHPVIMGRRTFESLPKGALPNRRNIIVTRRTDWKPKDAETADSLESAIRACSSGAEPFILGGGLIYEQAMPLASALRITEIDAEAPEADTHFPPINPDEWTVAYTSDWQTDPRSSVRFRFVDYTRK